jgi:hypothetical protein
MPSDASSAARIPFRQLRLRPKTLMQVCRIGDAGIWRTHDSGEPLDWTFCAAIPDRGLMLAPPAGQKRLSIAPGTLYSVQGFTGQYDFQFETMALGTFDAPFVYALLAWPEAVQARLVRQTLRVRTLLPAQLAPVAGGKGSAQAASVLDLSASGALIETLHPMGDVGDALRISFVVEADGEKAQITTDAVICHRRSLDAPIRERLGLSFRALPKTERLMLSIHLKELADSLDAS